MASRKRIKSAKRPQSSRNSSARRFARDLPKKPFDVAQLCNATLRPRHKVSFTSTNTLTEQISKLLKSGRKRKSSRSRKGDESINSAHLRNRSAAYSFMTPASPRSPPASSFRRNKDMSNSR